MIKVIKFQTDVILPSLSMVNSVIAPKNALPILGDVRVETKQDENHNSFIEFVASDSETWLKVKTSCVDAQIGISICIEAKSFLQALRNLGGKHVTMYVDDVKRAIKCEYDNGHFSLPYDNANEFPLPQEIHNDESTVSIDVAASKLLASIEKAGFATANDELRPVMNGVHFDLTHDGMVSVASDGHKLAKYKDLTIRLNDSETTHGFTLPKKPCHTLMNVLANTANEDVQLVFNDGIVTFGNSMFKLNARLIEGRYPNYEGVIPKDNSVFVTINKNAFVSALKRVLPMGSTTSELVVVSFDKENIDISAEDFEFSKSAKEHIVCDYNGEKISIGFKGSTLLQMLQNIDGENVRFELKDPTRAVVLKEENPNTTSDYTSLIMPMIVQ